MYSRLFVILPVLLLVTSLCYAQIEVATGADISYPLLTNNSNTKLNYNQVGFGMRFGVSYKPENTQFFPTLNFAFGRTRLPLKQFGDNVATVTLNYLNLMLDGNIVATFNNGNSLYFIGGIGFSSLSRAGFSIAGKNGEASKLYLDSVANVNKVFPAINFGIEYVYGASVNRKLYMSMGLNLQYIILLPGRNTYYADVRDYQGNTTTFNASLTGNAFIPNFYISLHYLLGKEIIFWKKKESSFYL